MFPGVSPYSQNGYPAGPSGPGMYGGFSQGFQTPGYPTGPMQETMYSQVMPMQGPGTGFGPGFGGGMPIVNNITINNNYGSNSNCGLGLPGGMPVAPMQGGYPGWGYDQQPFVFGGYQPNQGIAGYGPGYPMSVGGYQGSYPGYVDPAYAMFGPPVGSTPQFGGMESGFGQILQNLLCLFQMMMTLMSTVLTQPAADPANPSNPADPTSPSNPADPSSPSNPANPTTPSNPGNPESPEDPDETPDTPTPDPPDAPSVDELGEQWSATYRAQVAETDFFKDELDGIMDNLLFTYSPSRTDSQDGHKREIRDQLQGEYDIPEAQLDELGRAITLSYDPNARESQFLPQQQRAIEALRETIKNALLAKYNNDFVSGGGVAGLPDEMQDQLD